VGQAKHRKAASAAGTPWPQDASIYGAIELHILPPVSSITSDRVRELTGDDSIPPGKEVSLNAYRAVVGDRSFHVGFCLGDGKQFSAVGLAVIERMMLEAPEAPLHVVPVGDAEIAWDMVLRHLRTFVGQVLLFAFPNSTVYDAGTAEAKYAKEVSIFSDGVRLRRLTEDDRRQVKARVAALFGEAPPPAFYTMPGIDPHEQPWIFEMKASNGKTLHMTAWNGRKDFAHELPSDIINRVGGDRIAVVQVDSPVGVDGRSSVALSDALADDVDGIVHWARDTATYQSILKDFIGADLPSAMPPVLPLDWSPEVIFMPVNDGGSDGR
jgi:hypothetical protein